MKNEKDIIIKCQSGDLSEFARLYDAYARKIYDFIYYKTHHKETAEDLTSKTFFRAIKGFSSFNPESGSFSSWLFQIARNSVIDHYRSFKNEIDLEDVWDLAVDSGVERDFDACEKLKKVEKYIASLEREQREIIIMRVWQGMSYAEISAILGKTEAASKMVFARAISKLRESMPLELLALLLIIWE